MFRDLLPLLTELSSAVSTQLSYQPLWVDVRLFALYEYMCVWKGLKAFIISG
jgi:hypothetical protein